MEDAARYYRAVRQGWYKLHVQISCSFFKKSVWMKNSYDENKQLSEKELPGSLKFRGNHVFNKCIAWKELDLFLYGTFKKYLDAWE